MILELIRENRARREQSRLRAEQHKLQEEYHGVVKQMMESVEDNLPSARRQRRNMTGPELTERDVQILREVVKKYLPAGEREEGNSLQELFIEGCTQLFAWPGTGLLIEKSISANDLRKAINTAYGNFLQSKAVQVGKMLSQLDS